MDAVVLIACLMYTGTFLKVMLDLTGSVRNDEVHRDVTGEELLFDLLQEKVEADVAGSGDVYFITAVDRKLRKRILAVGLVHDVEDRDSAGTEVLQCPRSDVHMHLVVRVRAVDDLEYKVCIDRLLERRAESVDEVVRQTVDEADGIRQQEIAMVARGNFPDGGVEGREQHVLHHHLFFFIRTARLDEVVHKRGLAGVRVADECDLRDAGSLALATLGIAVLRNLAQLLPKLGHILLDTTTVELDLRLTGTLVRHGTAGTTLTTQVLTEADEARKHVLQLRVVDLQLRFLRTGTVCEDIQNQIGSVDDFDLEVMCEVREL